MLSTKIFQDDWDVDAQLARFDTARGELTEAARLTYAARADSVEADPLSGPRLLSYIYGTRYLRRVFCPKGYLIDRVENVESVRHPETGMRIVFQNVDLACSPLRSPKAISGKGVAAERMVDSAQGRLFSIADMPEVFLSPSSGALNKSVWYFCMSFDKEQFRAELSLPAAIRGSNFFGFIERIFIVGDADDDGIRVSRTDSDTPVELEPVISRK